jgi:oxygen-dependent protoporphyrinogen oxidase
MKNIAIIGAGLTGLTTAYYLKKAGFDVTIYEESHRCGGVIHSHYEEGFTYESGPNTGVLGNPEIVELFEDLARENLIDIADEKAQKRLIWKKGKWHALPSNLISAITTPLFSLKDKINVLYEPFRKKGNNPEESLASLVRRRLGISFLDYAIDPFIGGIYAGDPNTLIPKYALPKLHKLEQQYGSFIGGAIAKKKEKKTEREKKASKKVFSVKGGLEKLIHELVAAIGLENIFVGNSVSVKKEDDGYIVNNDVYDYLITTCNSNPLKKLLPFADINRLNDICSVKYAPVCQVIMGYKNWDGDDIMAFGGLIPSKEKKDLLGILFTSSFFKDRAPEGGVLLSIFIGGTRNEHLFNLSEEEIIALANKEVQKMLKPINAEQAFIRIFKHKYAIPQYEISSKERFEAIGALEKEHKGLIIGGNIINGIGMADRVKQAKDIADRITKSE